MNFKIKHFLIFCIILSLLIGILPSVAESDNVSEAQRLQNAIIKYELEKTNSDSVQNFINGYLTENAGISSEWFAIAIHQSGKYDLSGYGNALYAYLADNEINSASTRLKMILSLIASDSGEEYIENNLDTSIGKQGIMSKIFGIHAINNGAKSELHTVKSLADDILSLQLADGSWGLNGKNGDIDTTAMAVQALAVSYSEPETKTAVDNAIAFLSEKQQENGGYVMYGVNNPESVSQVIIALSALEIDCEQDERFIKNGNSLLDALSVFMLGDGSFAHTEGGQSNANATVQVLCAVIAYQRMHNNQTAFYQLDRHGLSSDTAPTEESDISVSDTESAEDGTVNEKTNPKIWIIIAIISVALILCIVLLICKNKNYFNYILIAVIAVAATVFVGVSDIKTPDEYYNDTESEKENIIGTVTISIRCDELIEKSDESHIPQNGIILNTSEFAIADGDTVYTVLREATAKSRIPLETNGNGQTVYVEGISNIYEFDFGDLSGWTYYVNGEITNLGCGEYKLSPNDKIEWVYTCDIGSEFENLS